VHIDYAYGFGSETIPIHERVLARDKYINKYHQYDIKKGKIVYDPNLQENDEVIIYKEKLGSKFKSRWLESYHITKKLSDDAYIVSDGKKFYRLNKKHIKKISRGERN
ncbi:hypothetical protein COBT_004272, partial [Conglomerata obtusa]